MVMGIGELDKPQGVWCPHCSAHTSCAIYDSRPQECRTFYCGWLTSDKLGPEWQPIRSKIVFTAELDGAGIVARVHPTRPDAWRKEPYYSQLKQWAVAGAKIGSQVMVGIGRRAIVILPDREVDLGVVGEDERIMTFGRLTGAGRELIPTKLHKDDPRIKSDPSAKPLVP
jgi:Fe-S-cluster containining protein